MLWKLEKEKRKENKKGYTEDIPFRKGSLVQRKRVIFGENAVIGLEDQQIRIFVANLLNVTKEETRDIQQPRCAMSPREQNWRG